MRRAWVALSISASACAPERPLVVHLAPESGYASALLVADWPRRKSVVAVDLARPELGVEPLVGDERAEIFVALYPSELEELGLTPGPLRAAVGDEPRLAFPPPSLVLHAELTVDGPAELWPSPAELPSELAALELAVSCPATLAPGRTLPAGCPLATTRPRACYGAAQPLDLGPDTNAADVIGAEVWEGADRWVYFATSRLSAGPGVRIARVPRAEGIAFDLARLEIVPILPRPEDRALGVTSPPAVRRDGLELAVHSTFGATLGSRERLFVAARRDLAHPFGPMVEVTALTDLVAGAPRWPALLPDHRTLVVTQSNPPGFGFARRPTATAGDPRFVPGALAPYPRPAHQVALSCDGGHLIFVAEPTDGGAVLMVARIRSVEPPELDVPEPLVIQGLAARDVSRATRVVESPDCERVYVSGSVAPFVAERLAVCE